MCCKRVNWFFFWFSSQLQLLLQRKISLLCGSHRVLSHFVLLAKVFWGVLYLKIGFCYLSNRFFSNLIRSNLPNWVSIVQWLSIAVTHWLRLIWKVFVWIRLNIRIWIWLLSNLSGIMSSTPRLRPPGSELLPLRWGEIRSITSKGFSWFFAIPIMLCDNFLHNR